MERSKFQQCGPDVTLLIFTHLRMQHLARISCIEKFCYDVVSDIVKLHNSTGPHQILYDTYKNAINNQLNAVQMALALKKYGCLDILNTIKLPTAIQRYLYINVNKNPDFVDSNKFTYLLNKLDTVYNCNNSLVCKVYLQILTNVYKNSFNLIKFIYENQKKLIKIMLTSLGSFRSEYIICNVIKLIHWELECYGVGICNVIMENILESKLLLKMLNLLLYRNNDYCYKCQVVYKLSDIFYKYDLITNDHHFNCNIIEQLLLILIEYLSEPMFSNNQYLFKIIHSFLDDRYIHSFSKETIKYLLRNTLLNINKQIDDKCAKFVNKVLIKACSIILKQNEVLISVKTIWNHLFDYFNVNLDGPIKKKSVSKCLILSHIITNIMCNFIKSKYQYFIKELYPNDSTNRMDSNGIMRNWNKLIKQLSDIYCKLWEHKHIMNKHMIELIFYLLNEAKLSDPNSFMNLTFAIFKYICANMHNTNLNLLVLICKKYSYWFKSFTNTHCDLLTKNLSKKMNSQNYKLYIQIFKCILKFKKCNNIELDVLHMGQIREQVYLCLFV